MSESSGISMKCWYLMVVAAFKCHVKVSNPLTELVIYRMRRIAKRSVRIVEHGVPIASHPGGCLEKSLTEQHLREETGFGGTRAWDWCEFWTGNIDVVRLGRCKILFHF